MTKDTNIRVDRKVAEAIKRIGKSRGWTVKHTVSAMLAFYKEATIIK
jgi:hypothetical protein